MNYNTTLPAREFYRYPSVEIVYAFAALLCVELVFLAIHIILQLKKGAKNFFVKGMVIAEIAYLIAYSISIFLTYYQQYDGEISIAVFTLALIIVIIDSLFTTTRSALFTSNRIVLKPQSHRRLLIFNLICTAVFPTIAIPLYTVRRLYLSASWYKYTDIVTGFLFLLYLLMQIINTIVFLYITHTIKNSLEDNGQPIQVGKLRLYTSNLILNGLISKAYAIVLTMISGDLMFPWSNVIFDGCLLCFYFVVITVGKLRRMAFERSGIHAIDNLTYKVSTIEVTEGSNKDTEAISEQKKKQQVALEDLKN